MKISSVFRSFFLLTMLLCSFTFFSANATDTATINNDDGDDDSSADGLRFIQTAKLAVANVNGDLTVPEQYFLQGCLRKALETSEHQDNLITLEVIESSSLSSSGEEKDQQHLRSLTDWSWLYSYSIFFEYDSDCYYDDYICNFGGRRRLGRQKQQRRIERYVCKHLQQGPYPVFHAAADCHVVLDHVEHAE